MNATFSVIFKHCAFKQTWVFTDKLKDTLWDQNDRNGAKWDIFADFPILWYFAHYLSENLSFSWLIGVIKLICAQIRFFPLIPFPFRFAVRTNCVPLKNLLVMKGKQQLYIIFSAFTGAAAEAASEVILEEKTSCVRTRLWSSS